MILILMYFKIASTLGAASLLVLTGCGVSETETTSGEGNDDGRIQVAAAFYPLEYATQIVGGDAIEVTPLTIPGVEAHDVELTPQQVAAVVNADLIVYLSEFQPAIDEAVTQADPAKVMDVAEFADLMAVDDEGHFIEDSHSEDDHAEDSHSEDDHAEEGHTEDDHAEEGHDHGDYDPHFWLDPLRLAAVTDAIADRLADMLPEEADSFTAAAASSRTEFTALDEEFMEGLQNCERRSLFTSHAAFGYLSDRYDLDQVSVVGISPNVEPSGARIAEVQELAREYDATTIFFETTASDAVAESIAADLGMQTAVLDPVASLNAQSIGEDYLGIMRANLGAIQEANGCG
ncbi:MAG: metal ABC transporter substrate-binding protein [Arachnia sp.]